MIAAVRLRHPSIYTARLFCSKSCSKLFVGGLSFDTNETVLKDAFRQFGEITDVKVICHHVTGKSRGYGFVQFKLGTSATIALQEWDDQILDGRIIRLEYARKG